MVLLVEYSSNDISGVSDTVVNQLQESNQRWKRALELRKPPFQLNRDGSEATIIPRGVCGQIEVSNQIFEIVPKYLANDDEVPSDWRNKFLRILSFSGISEFSADFAETIRGGSSESSLMDIIAAAYADRLSTALAQGPPAAYTESEEQLSNARGRLITQELYPNLLKKPSELWYRTTEYTTDIHISKILKLACQRFSELTTDTQTVNLLYELEQRFSEIDSVDISEIRPGQFSISSQHRRFEEALTIAQWLIKNLDAAYTGEEVTLPGILFNSETMYEGFVDTVLDTVDIPWDYTGDDTETYQRLASGTPNQNINPDHLFKLDDQYVLILDSKYTKMGSGIDNHGNKPERDYFYQVLAYGRGYQADTVGLVYPRLRTTTSCWELETPGYPSTVYVLEIDPVEYLSDPEDFFETIQESLIRLL
jgi:5-methylcytosine-specific restriction endonuclease McrBC regulatory subunit McrC